MANIQHGSWSLLSERNLDPTSVVSFEKLLSIFVRFDGPLTLFVRLVALSRRAAILVESLPRTSSLDSPFRFPFWRISMHEKIIDVFFVLTTYRRSRRIGRYFTDNSRCRARHWLRRFDRWWRHWCNNMVKMIQIGVRWGQGWCDIARIRSGRWTRPSWNTTTSHRYCSCCHWRRGWWQY